MEFRWTPTAATYTDGVEVIRRFPAPRGAHVRAVVVAGACIGAVEWAAIGRYGWPTGVQAAAVAGGVVVGAFWRDWISPAGVLGGWRRWARRHWARAYACTHDVAMEVTEDGLLCREGAADVLWYWESMGNWGRSDRCVVVQIGHEGVRSPWSALAVPAEAGPIDELGEVLEQRLGTPATDQRAM